MRRLTTMVAMTAMVMGLARPAQAGDTKLLTGIILIGAGGGMAAGAFNYDSHCAPGATKYTFTTDYGTETNCISVTSKSSSVTSPLTTASLERKGLLYAGIGTAVAGTIVLLLPKKAQGVVAPVVSGTAVVATPGGWRVSKRVTW